MNTRFFAICLSLTVLMASACDGRKDDHSEGISFPKVEAVDLGLGVKWASANVGAASPSQTGYYFAWGEVDIKTDYSWATYKWADGSSASLNKYQKPGSAVLLSSDDIAAVAYGGKWRMPTKAEWKALKDNCTWTKKVVNDVFLGYTVSNEELGTSIFLPACGGRQDTGVHRSRDGFYWASDLSDGTDANANVFFFTNGGLALSSGERSYGLSVRAVLSE